MGQEKIADLFRGFQRTLLLEIMIIGDQSINDISHLMHVPKALHAVRRPDIAEMTVGLLRGKCFVPTTGPSAGQHLFVAGIGGQLDGRIDQLTEPDVTIAAALASK